MIAQMGPWIGAIGGILAVLGYLTAVTQIRTRLDMFIEAQHDFKAEVRNDFERLGARLERAITSIGSNSKETAELATRVSLLEERMKGVVSDEGGGS